MQMLGFQEKVAYKQPNVPTYCFSSSNLISIITPFCSKNINDYPTLRSNEDIDHVTIRTVVSRFKVVFIQSRKRKLY